MTRLTEGDIANLPELLPRVELAFLRATGLGLRDLALRGAFGADAGGTRPFSQGYSHPNAPPADLSVAVVPVSAGQGFIRGFASAVAAVCRHVGLDAFVTDETDVAGLASAAERGARLVFLADDHAFICLDLRSGRVGENGAATGRGYAAALAAAGERAATAGARGCFLVLGLGPVGRAAADWLIAAGKRVAAYEPDEARAERASADGSLRLVESLEEGLALCDLILDATPSAGFIRREHLRPTSVVAAPGMPLGLTSDAASQLMDRLLHEPLALGVATMAFLALEDDSLFSG